MCNVKKKHKKLAYFISLLIKNNLKIATKFNNCTKIVKKSKNTLKITKFINKYYLIIFLFYQVYYNKIVYKKLT